MDSALYHQILDYLRGLIEGTQWEGHVFAVGGCCRDEILGSPIKDVDLAIDLPGGGIDFAMWLHEKDLTVKEPTCFKTFGTAMLRLKAYPDDEIELVQTRAEKYTDSTRRDPTVVFGPIEQDCARRDLTINALYYDISRRRMLDILGTSIDDIHRGIIRTPADPDTTFDDDPVRILRAVRFSARYGWPIEEATLEAMRRNVARLEIVRRERMAAEFDKMLVGPRPDVALRLLEQIGALPYVMPQLQAMVGVEQGPSQKGDVWEHSLEVMRRMPPVAVLRMAGLLHDIGKPSCRTVAANGQPRFYGHERRCRGIVHAALRHLHYDSSFIEKVLFLITNHMQAKSWGPHAEHMTDQALRRLQYRCVSNERFRRLMALIDADNCSSAPEAAMPEQTAAIIERSDSLVAEHKALFSHRCPFNSKQIRRITGASRDADLEPYRDFLFELAVEDPTLSRKALERRLGRYARRNKR